MPDPRGRSRFPLVAFFFILALGLSGGLLVHSHLLGTFVRPELPPSAAPDFQLMNEAWRVIQKSYMDRSALDGRRLTYGAISGLVDALGDPGHSRFLTPEMARQEQSFIKGKFEGIGAEVRLKDNRVVILAPMDGSPAQRAGLRPGDIILRVNGVSVDGLSLDQVVTRILGPAGSSVRLTILTPKSGATREVHLVRERFPLRSVSWHQLPGTAVAHVRLSSFSPGTSRDLRRILKEIRQKNLGWIILDLRNDPGGLLEEAVATASQFLSGGNVLFEKKAGGQVTPVPVQVGGLAVDLPLAVLVNGGTGSAAEIVAGAIQDARRAPLIGETTFGSGTVLQVFPLSDGSALLLAIEEWLTPGGRTIRHQGISPDFAVPSDPEKHPLIPAGERPKTLAELRASGDDQLLKALDLLSSSPLPAHSPAVDRSAFPPAPLP